MIVYPRRTSARACACSLIALLGAGALTAAASPSLAAEADGARAKDAPELEVVFSFLSLPQAATPKASRTARP